MKHTTLLLAVAALICGACTSGPQTDLALMRPAWHSSAINYDLTAQLATDGIGCESGPSLYKATLGGKPLTKQHLAWLFEERHYPFFHSEGSELDLQIDFVGMEVSADSFIFRCLPDYGATEERDCHMDIEISADGQTWQNVLSTDSFEGIGSYDDRGRRAAHPVFDATPIKGIRVKAGGKGIGYWTIAGFELFLNGEWQDVNDRFVPFSSCWVPEGTGKEWIYTDLGKRSRIDRVEADWAMEPASWNILVSDDAKNWRRLLRWGASARYVKLECDCGGNMVALSELRVLGPRTQECTADSDGWKLVREDLAADDWAWVPCTLPCTVLAAYIDNGIVQDPAWADNNEHISDSYFKSNFIYRGTMQAPEDLGGKVWLNFDGINWKADVSLNGTPCGHIDGAFIRTRLDVTELVHPGANDVEVLIYCNDHPSCGKGNTVERDAFNGGILGADNPTFHASIGWDWIPSVHGRNIGIWNDVYFSTSGSVLVEDPFVQTKLNLPDTTVATVRLSAVLHNAGSEAVKAEWKASLAGQEASAAVMLKAGEKREVSQTLVIENPRLWWPNGYGEPNLYDVSMSAVVDGQQTDSKEFRTGLRQNTYSTEGGRLTAWINGRRFSGRGGNWGFSEFNLRFREKEYDTAVRLHKEQNFTMIRNWVGMIMDDEFWEACDRHGIMVWQDFWLANPGDGPNPDDEKMFMDNARDLLLRIRNHPCIVVYIGRNEGLPPASLDAALEASVAELHPDIFYYPDSSHGLVGGNGNYRRQSALEFFGIWDTAPALWGQNRIHSEKGMPNVPNYESVARFIPREHLWPQDRMWAVHDWVTESAQRVGTFTDAVESMFGKAGSAEEFCEWAQWVNYDGYRAIFESRSEQRRGLQLWMSHSAWPTFVWCTYDYWFDPTGAFFGCRKACEPLHIQWNPLKEVVEVVNISGGNRSGLTAECKVLDMYGKVLSCTSEAIDSPEDSTVPCMGFEVPDCDVYYLRLTLNQGESAVSENTYVLGRQTDDFKALHQLAKAKLKVERSTEQAGSEWITRVQLENCGDTPALMIRLTAMERRGGERVLPVSYSDNYFHMMPGEKREILVKVDAENCAEAPYIRVKGFNVKEK